MYSVEYMVFISVSTNIIELICNEIRPSMEIPNANPLNDANVGVKKSCTLMLDQSSILIKVDLKT